MPAGAFQWVGKSVGVLGCTHRTWTAQGGLESPSLEVSKEHLDVALSALLCLTRSDSVMAWTQRPWKSFPTSVVLGCCSCTTTNVSEIPFLARFTSCGIKPQNPAPSCGRREKGFQTLITTTSKAPSSSPSTWSSPRSS